MTNQCSRPLRATDAGSHSQQWKHIKELYPQSKAHHLLTQHSPPVDGTRAGSGGLVIRAGLLLLDGDGGTNEIVEQYRHAHLAPTPTQRRHIGSRLKWRESEQGPHVDLLLVQINGQY